MTTYGYVGLGEMGSAIVDRLLASEASVTVHDIDSSRMASAVEKGAVEASSAADVSAAADIVGVCVPADRHVEEVITGSGGICETATAGQVILVHSTILPETVIKVRDAVSGWEGILHDACVAGGVNAARKGQLVLLVGGLDDLPGPAAELLALLGDKLIDAGPVGSGAALKVAVNVMSYAQFSAAAAAHDVLAGTGTDPEGLLEAWRHIGQLGRLTEAFIGLLNLPEDVVTGDMRSYLTTTAEIAYKDLTLADEMATDGTDLQALLHSLREAVPEVFRVKIMAVDDD
ncbi:MAG: NAD(P)-binding domain-containing protein [Actinomycetota bacterium]|nr:NAD(P)-binding domain-containing protein [Actinomycetota bacterium]